MGVSFHNTLRRKDVSSGPSPLCLDSLIVLFQSVSGLSISHLSGFIGQSENVVSMSPTWVCIYVLRVDDIRKSYTPLIEICSILAIELFSLQIISKKSLPK